MKDKPDRLDIKILSLVQENNQLTTTEIGDRVGLSKSAVQRRSKSLRESGLVVADVAVPNPDELGPYLTFILLITLKPDLARTMQHTTERFGKAMSKRPEVQQCYHTSGSIDFVAIVNVTDQKQFNELTQELLYEDPDVARFESRLVLERTKIGLQLPLS